MRERFSGDARFGGQEGHPENTVFDHSQPF